MKKITLLTFLLLFAANSIFAQITPTLLVTVNNVVNATNCTLCNGAAKMNVTGGTVPYHYSWPSGESTQTAVALCVGTFTCGAYDSAIPIPGFGIGNFTVGCAGLGVNNMSVDESVNIYPVPATSELFVELQAVFQGQVSLTITNVIGEKIYSESLESTGTTYRGLNISGLQPGCYFLECTNGILSTRKKFIKQ